MTGSVFLFMFFRHNAGAHILYSGDVFQDDTKDMKKKLMSEWGSFSSQGGGNLSSLRKNKRP